jgi:hypothetical protein
VRDRRPWCLFARSFYLAYIDTVEHVGREDSFQEFSTMTRDVIEGLYADVVRSGNDTGQFDRRDIDDAARDVRIVVDGLFVRWLQVTDWAAAHEDYKRHCRRLLGIVLRERSG